MSLLHLQKLLQAYQPSAEEVEYKRKMLDFLQTYPDCCERSLQIGHFTASAFLLNKQGTHALLMHHAKLNIWVQPGGHADGKTDLLAVALNEAQEESGILHITPLLTSIFDIDIHDIPPYKHEPAHQHYDVRFILKVMSDEFVVQNHEAHDLQWFSESIARLPTQQRSVVRLFEKWQKLKNN